MGRGVKNRVMRKEERGRIRKKEGKKRKKTIEKREGEAEERVLRVGETGEEV